MKRRTRSAGLRTEVVRGVFVFESRNQLAATLEEAADWDWIGQLGSQVVLWVGDDAAFPCRYVGYRFSRLPAALLEPMDADHLHVIDQLVRENPAATIRLTTARLPTSP